MRVSVIIPTHNPHRGRLERTLAGLRAQTLPASDWELFVVDNASAPALNAADLAPHAPLNLRVVREPELGLTSARRCGIRAAAGDLIVLVDDDNVLAPDYLDQVVAIFGAHPRIGAIGGKSIGEFETPRPAWWQPEFDGLLALRDLGDAPQICSALRDPRAARNEYPVCAPIGAGMALRRSAVEAWLNAPASPSLSDRRGSALTSGGDNDIVLTVLGAGWGVGYFPQLSLTHLIPAGRLSASYLSRLNRGIAESWVQVLTKHEACPWRPIAPWTVPLRQLKAWFAYRAWAGPAARIRWQGACGHFVGLATVSRRP